MARINTKVLRKELTNGIINDNGIRDRMYNEAGNRLAREKARFLSKFENHVVSKEIADGPETSNSSNTLNGRGNLFSFIGFDAGDEPVERAADYFDKNIKLETIIQPKITEQVTQVKFSYKVSIPDGTDINNAKDLQMPPRWDTGSWLLKIENGMSGLTHYMFALVNKFKNSHSGTAVQVKQPLRSIIFKPRKYITSLLKDFISRLDDRAR